MDKYAIRRAIINALKDYENPQDFETVLANHRIILAVGKASLSHDDIRDVRAEWNFLISKDYIKPVPGYDDYAKLSAEIRSELESADPLGLSPFLRDERLYGPAALGK